MFNVKDAAQVSLGVFGGLVTNMPAINLPPGVSPDLKNMVFRPQSVYTRPGAVRVFGTGDAALPTYAKSYVDNQKVIRNLYMDSDGNLTVENLNTNPNTKTLVGTFTPGSYAKSITAFDREFIAISNGLIGTDIPMAYDGTNLDRVTQDGPGDPPAIESTRLDAVAMDPVLSGGNTMERSGNLVTVATAAPHNLQVGYLAHITDVPAATIDTGIDTITIDNASLPGQATVKMTANHGLSAGLRVSISMVPVSGVAVIRTGSSPSGITRRGNIVTVITETPHGLVPGTIIQIIGCFQDDFNVGAPVAEIIDPYTFTFLQTDETDNAASSGGVYKAWPFPSAGGNGQGGAVFEILSVPTEDTFTIPLQYGDGTWSGGTVTFEWNGQFFVKTVIGANTFQYQQYGPDATTTDVGMVTPTGQAAPGQHRMMVMYQTRNGYITAASPWVEFQANGGEYLSISDIPIGPENVVARILAFTGAEGSEFLYLATPAMNRGQIVSTSTVIQDNTTTAATLDFSDNSLFTGINVTQPGNEVANQIVLDSALGFALFNSRLLTYGQRNCVAFFQNMHFDGGALPSTPTIPTGWLPQLYTGAGGMLVTTGRWGGAWQFGGAGYIYQSAYLSSRSVPLATPNTQYTLRAWVKDGSATVEISSDDTGFSSTATLGPADPAGEWLEADFSDPMPTAIPPDLIIKVFGDEDAIIDELSIIFTISPFRDKLMLGSYVNNEEAFDGLSGEFGVQDTRKIMTTSMIRGTLYILTQDPTGRLHVINANAITEPSGWSVEEVASECGVVSTFGCTISQANDETASGGEQFFAWMSATGARIFGGDQAFSISQEIQPNINRVNTEAWTTVWAVNDPNSQRIYFGLPIGDVAEETPASAPNWIYHMDYKQLDTAAQIAQADPVDNGRTREPARKWGPWDLAANGGVQMYRSVGGPLTTVLLGGNGQFPGVSDDGCGNVFTLVEHTQDSCQGRISSYYFTYAFTGEQGEQSYSLGGQRKLLQYLQWAAAGTGHLKVEVHPTALTSLDLVAPHDNIFIDPWPLDVVVRLREDPKFDFEWGGGQASGQRFFLKFEPVE